jgi:hypothetical protein
MLQLRLAAAGAAVACLLEVLHWLGLSTFWCLHRPNPPGEMSACIVLTARNLQSDDQQKCELATSQAHVQSMSKYTAREIQAVANASMSCDIIMLNPCCCQLRHWLYIFTFPTPYVLAVHNRRLPGSLEKPHTMQEKGDETVPQAVHWVHIPCDYS